MRVAITRPTGPELAACELTHLPRVPIDVDRASHQHETYVATLRDLGVHVVELDRLPEHPDAVFVEDTALVLDEVAVMLHPGVDSRVGELPSVAAALARYRPLTNLPAGHVDGGDVVVLDRTILVGATGRSDETGAAALRSTVAPFGYEVRTVPVTGCLHLKTALTAADDETLVAHAPFVDLAGIDARVLVVPDTEPQGANVVQVGDTLLVDATAPRTADMLVHADYPIVPVDVSEFAKAEGALTCKSLVFEELGATSRGRSGRVFRT